MASTYTTTGLTAALKELYDGQTVESVTYKDRPTLAMIPKMTDFQGKLYPLPLNYNNSAGASVTFANAQANMYAADVVQFALTRKTEYSIAQMETELLRAAASDKGSFLRGAKFAIDKALDACAERISAKLFGSGTGSVGQISAITTGVVTLTDPGSVVKFAKGMKFGATQTDGGTAESGTGFVIALDRSAGTVTFSTTVAGAAGTPTGWSANDFLVQDGDLNAGFTGLAGWIPATAPGATAFFGVDRSVDTTRLAGVRYSGSSQSIEEALIDSSLLLAREGGKPDFCVMSYASYAALLKALGSRANYINPKGPAGLSFRGVAINGANNEIQVFPDRDCPGLRAYMLTLDTWKLYSLGKAPGIIDDVDGQWLRVANADAAEVRVGAYLQLGCSAPAYNATVSLGA